MQRSLIVLFASALCADAALLRNVSSPVGVKSLLMAPKSGPYGLPNCPCVGLDAVEGKVDAVIDAKTGKTHPYPADMGARCEAWDAKNHPKCPGESWCEAKWCYVDPCNCDKVSPYPKPANYLPNSQYQGKPVHFSYATCDGMDSYSETGAGSDYEQVEKTCAAPVDSATWGHEDCRCVGFAPQEGTMKVDIEGKQVDFPADTGGQCKAWEKANHPECKGSSPPSWCSQSWCYVDPCKCKSAAPPKVSSYVPDANYQGRPVYYSYEACGGTDSYTSTEHKSACVNQKDKEACGKLSKCAWNGKDCLGKELVEVCSGAFGLQAIIALALPILSLVW
jgi:hypothetical protein